MAKPCQPLDLMRKGFSLLREHHYEDALKVGRELKKLRHSSAFEILALAYLHSNMLTRAVAVLEQGVQKADRVWILWELLGNCYSDSGRYEKAEKAYIQALAREGCDAGVVHLNRAIAFERRGKFPEAKTALRHVKSPRLVPRAEACGIRASLGLGNSRSAQQLANRLCRRHPIAPKNYDPANQSTLYLACALAFENKPLTRRKALRLARTALEADPQNREALAAIRRMASRTTSHPSAYYRLLIHGVWNVAFDKYRLPPGFYRMVEIAAPNCQAAMRFILPFFPKLVRDSLSIEEETIVRKPGHFSQGVYSLSEYSFYPRRKSK
jgi:tetratricopeptide (TPR) repeat protein